MRQWDKEELAWAAGLFEGEGWISPHQKKDRPHIRSIQIGLTSTDHDVVERFRQVVGFGHVYGPYQGARRRLDSGSMGIIPKEQWRYTCYAHDQVVQLIVLVWPWLGQRRKARAHDLLLWRQNRAELLIDGSN